MKNKEIEEEFNRIVEQIRTQGDIDCLMDLIPFESKKQFIEDWKKQ